VKLNIYLQVPRLRSWGAVPPLPHTTSWYGAWLSLETTLLRISKQTHTQTCSHVHVTNSMELSPWEAVVEQLVKKLLAFCGTWGSFHCSQEPGISSCPEWHVSSSHTSTLCVCASIHAFTCVHLCMYFFYHFAHRLIAKFDSRPLYIKIPRYLSFEDKFDIKFCTSTNRLLN
jgi:hypothetical protein